MENSVNKKLNLMINNFYELKDEFRWDNNLIKYFGAMMLALKNKSINTNDIKEIREYIKDNTGLMSAFRGNNLLIMSILLAMEKDYKEFFSGMQIGYENFKNQGFSSSAYTPLVAYIFVKEIGDKDENLMRLRMKAFYKKMKENHFWLTSADDYAHAAILAMTDFEVEYASLKSEECYTYLNSKKFYKGNDLQALANTLALSSEETNIKCDRAIALYEGLKNNKCKLEYKGLPTLGLLTQVTDDVDKIVTEISEVYESLAQTKGFGSWSIDKTMRAMLAATLVADNYIDGIKNGMLSLTLGNSINAIMIAQQQACMAGVISASAATSAQ